MKVPLRASEDFSRLIVNDVEPVAGRIVRVPEPLAVFGLSDGIRPGCRRGSEYRKENVHERVVRVIVARPFAIHNRIKFGFRGAFFQGRRHFGWCTRGTSTNGAGGGAMSLARLWVLEGKRSQERLLQGRWRVWEERTSVEAELML